MVSPTASTKIEKTENQNSTSPQNIVSNPNVLSEQTAQVEAESFPGEWRKWDQLQNTANEWRVFDRATHSWKTCKQTA